MMVLVAMGPVGTLLARPSNPSGIALIILPPWVDRTELLHVVNGSEIGPAQSPFGILVKTSHPDLAKAAHDAGAWWVTSGAGLAAICGVQI